MSITITSENLLEIFPYIKESDEWASLLNKELPKYDINTIPRVAGFLSQVGMESMEFRALEENMNYNSDGLRRVFPKYFPTVAIANQYARNPARIANHVYANRMGNGDEASGDGWKYHGRGLIHLTGKSNYESFSKDADMPIDQCVEYFSTKDGAIHSACWFWGIRHINKEADAKEIVIMTKLVNGGTNGLQARTRYYNKALSVLK